MELSKTNLRAIMLYKCKRGLNASQMTVEMRDTLSNVVTEQTCRNWIGKF